MAFPSSLRHRLVGCALVLQIVPIGYGLVLAEARRDDDQAVLLIPVSAAARRSLPARALDGHSRLIGGGVVPGSLVVRREDGNLPPFWHDDVVAVPVPPAVCGRRGGA